jgi:uncharacterized protein YutE (UPF0331/DUF86 family)
MKFQDYLLKTKDIANEEKSVLDQLRAVAAHSELDSIQIRAAKSSLQVLIENAIGKAKRILKFYQCPMVFHKGKDAFWVLTETGLIDESLQAVMNQAIGFRNSMIHDYMNFDEKTLIEIVVKGQYLPLYDFLVAPVEPSDTVKRRISSFSY